MISPSNGQRRALRAAIAAHPEWKTYRATSGRGDVSTLSGAACLDVCRALGIDPGAILFSDAAPVSAPIPAPTISDPAPMTYAAPVAPSGLFTPGAPDPAPVAAPDPAPVAAPDPAPVAPGVAPDLAAALATIAAAVNAPPAPGVDLTPVLDRVAALETAVESIAAPAPVVIAVDAAGAPLGDALPSDRHPMAETLLRAITARDASGARLNVWIAGPAGSGKTYAAKQAAAALGLEFGFHGSMSMPHELLGFVDAGGVYRETVFVRLFMAGGVCLLDEIDAGSDDARLSINAALANGLLSLPDGRIVERHPDFVCIAAANTWGAGATADYVGRAKIDAATLSRFPVKIAWEYDAALERAICGNPDWAARVQAARQRARDAGVKHVIDPRHSMAGAALIAAGFSADDAARMTYLAGLAPAQAAIVEGGAA
jgi:MoxR-like ATPase